MSTFQRILFFFVLPIIAPLLLPPRMLVGGFLGIIVEVILFVALGFFLLRGRLHCAHPEHLLARFECHRPHDDVFPTRHLRGWHS